MMRKLIALILAAALTAAMLSGCSSAPTPEESSAAPPASAGEPAPEQPAGEPSSAPAAPEQSSQPEAEPEPAGDPAPAGDWLSEHGITITPQGGPHPVTLQGFGNAGDTTDFAANVTVTITESREGAEPGEKKVTALFDIDYADDPLDNVNFWTSAFDRYTGSSFEFDTSLTATDVGQQASKEGYARIVNGGEHYDVAIEFRTSSEYRLVHKTIVVTCPEDYNGTVFQIGYDCAEKREQNAKNDFAARLYTIDELPFFGEGYLYFTMGNN